MAVHAECCNVSQCAEVLQVLQYIISRTCHELQDQQRRLAPGQRAHAGELHEVERLGQPHQPSHLQHASSNSVQYSTYMRDM